MVLKLQKESDNCFFCFQRFRTLSKATKKLSTKIGTPEVPKTAEIQNGRHLDKEVLITPLLSNLEEKTVLRANRKPHMGFRNMTLFFTYDDLVTS